MIDTTQLGTLPVEADLDPRLERALNEMEDAHDDREVAVAFARRAMKIEPACAQALLVLSENAATAVERVALLKEIVSIYKRRVSAGALQEIRSIWDRDVKNLIAALICLGDELSELGDHEEAKACFRYVSGLDEADRFGAGRALEELEERGRRPGM